MVTKKQSGSPGLAGQAGKAEGDSFENPRFDEILTLLSRNQQKVLDRTFAKENGQDRVNAAVPAKWQVAVQEVEQKGYGTTKSRDVGHADLVIDLGKRAYYGDCKLMLLCRPTLQSASATLKTLNTLSTRPNVALSGTDIGHRDEVWGIATDNPSMRDVFEGNGYKYICTQWDDIDGWGRTDPAPIKKVWREEDESGGAAQWVVIESDCSGVSTVRVTSRKVDAVAAFAQMLYLFAYAFPENEFKVTGSDDDAALEGLRLMMGSKVDADDKESATSWVAVCQICKAMQTSTDVVLEKSLAEVAEMPFEVMDLALTEVLRDRGSKLDAAESVRLQHSWPALLYYRDLADLMVEEVERREGRGSKRKSGKLQDELWDAIAKVRSSTMTTAVIS